MERKDGGTPAARSGVHDPPRRPSGSTRRGLWLARHALAHRNPAVASGGAVHIGATEPPSTTRTSLSRHHGAPMLRFLILAVVFCALVPAGVAWSAPLTERSRLSTAGLGPVKIGMSKSQAERAARVPLRWS